MEQAYSQSIEHTAAAMRKENKHAPPIDASTMNLLQKSGFFFFSVASLFLVLYSIIVILLPDTAAIPRYPPEMLFLIGLFAIGFLLASIIAELVWLEPVLLLVFLPLHLSDHITSMYSMCAFIIAIIELYRIDYFKTGGLAKIFLCFAYYALSIALVGTALRVFFVEIAMPIIFIFLFFLYLLPVFKGKWQIRIARPRQTIHYKELNLTDRETDYLKECLHGAAFKEIAAHHHVSESTVRNTFAHIYHKFSVTDKAELLSKFADFDIID